MGRLGTQTASNMMCYVCNNGAKDYIYLEINDHLVYKMASEKTYKRPLIVKGVTNMDIKGEGNLYIHFPDAKGNVQDICINTYALNQGSLDIVVYGSQSIDIAFPGTRKDDISLTPGTTTDKDGEPFNYKVHRVRQDK